MSTQALGRLQTFCVKAFNEAVDRRDVKALDALIDLHPELTHVQDIVHGDTFLHWMADGSMTSWVSWALDKGIDVNIPNKHGDTALHIAANLDDGDMVDLLVARGANIEALDKNGNTPLGIAGGFGCEMALERLMKHGAHPWVLDNRGQSFITGFLNCDSHRDWEQSLATAKAIEGMLNSNEEIGALAWETMQNNPTNLALNQQRFPALVCALEATWLRKQQPQAIVQAPSRPRF